MPDFIAVLGAVLLLGALVGTMFTMYRHSLASQEALEYADHKAERKDHIVELANAVEDRNAYIIELRSCITSMTEGECPLLKGTVPDIPEWLREDERL